MQVRNIDPCLLIAAAACCVRLHVLFYPKNAIITTNCIPFKNIMQAEQIISLLCVFDMIIVADLHSERVQGLVAKMTVAEKSRQLDIFRTADMLTNGHVNKSKAEEVIGNLSLGVGVLHDFYPYPQIANELMDMLLQESASKVPPLVGAEATHGLQVCLEISSQKLIPPPFLK